MKSFLMLCPEPQTLVVGGKPLSRGSSLLKGKQLCFQHVYNFWAIEKEAPEKFRAIFEEVSEKRELCGVFYGDDLLVLESLEEVCMKVKTWASGDELELVFDSIRYLGDLLQDILDTTKYWGVTVTFLREGLSTRGMQNQ